MPPKANDNLSEVGRIERFFGGIALLRGLPHVALHEVLVDEDGEPCAVTVGFNEKFVEALFFDEGFDPTRPVQRGRRPVSVPVSDAHASRVLDGLGRSRDGLPFVAGEDRPLFGPAPAIIERGQVNRPLITGIKIIDAILPLGRGQRELIIGDRRVGKSVIGLDAILHQRESDDPVHCVYVSIGNKSRHVEDTVRLLRDKGAMLYTTVVAATADDTYASQYLAPFVGCAIAEHFRDRGADALVVYDDLTKHAKVYRDISLLLERAPGRETYPADIFSLHAGLLERAAQLSGERGGGSLTALPIIETEEGDLTSYVPTNLISITDGQIYLERGLKEKGFVPAVNAGLSVSRLGGQVQPPPLKEVTSGLRLSLAQQRELLKLTELEAAVSEESRKKLSRGGLILEMLKQEKHRTLRWEEETVLVYSVQRGFFDDLPKEKWPHLEELLLDVFRNTGSETLSAIRNGRFDDQVRRKLDATVSTFRDEFLNV